MTESFDVGVSAAQVEELLERSPVVAIVGFQRSGKSALAEMLDEDLRASGRDVFMQSASSWVRNASSASGETQTNAAVDPEIVYAMDRLERAPLGGCWIVDDAEVMLAYATDGLLANLGERLRQRHFAAVLIRNRFLLEGQGWFHERQSLIATNIPTLNMRPLRRQYSVDLATAMFPYGPSRDRQGAWLASMSGGVPGLMSDLYQYTPPGTFLDPDPPLIRFALRRREDLGLGRPLRQRLIGALARQVLPPAPLLASQARTELGALMLAGMVSPQYAMGENPFNGRFWELVAERPIVRQTIPVAYQDYGLNLEIMLSDAGLADAFSQECGVESREEGELARALAAGFYCEHEFPELVRPSGQFFGESLGRFGLSQILRSQGLSVAPGLSSGDMVHLLFERARS